MPEPTKVPGSPMNLKDANIAIVTTVGAVASHDDVRFDTSWGRFLDAVASRCRHLHTCVRRQAKTRADVYTYALTSGNVSVRLLPPAHSSLHSLPQVLQLAGRFHQVIKDVDLVFVRGLFPGWAFVWAYCRITGTPICLQLPGNPLKLLRTHRRFSWVRQMGSILYMRCAYLLLDIVRRGRRFHLICNGTELAELFPGPRTHAVISASLLADEFHIRRDTCTGPRIDFVFVGLVRPEKGLSYLLEALARLEIDRPWTLHIIGNHDHYPRETARLRALARDLCIDGSIIWHGHLPFGRALFDRLKSSDVFVLPSLSEGTPRVLVEARAFGLPMVATSVGGIPASTTEGEDGLLVASHDAGALCRALGRVIDDGALRRRLIKGGYARARRHTVSHFADRIQKIMEAQLQGIGH